ncbi:unnamed protein product [Ranitomeya imitator]|uniref:Uncharacterized protein n=1 Tax=Ranitomeya imitator TaxID=111125 RepID=A0ABN9MAV7_9NEOB|nr:unnamed protein product [Ranitomeya imitator]
MPNPTVKLNLYCQRAASSTATLQRQLPPSVNGPPSPINEMPLDVPLQLSLLQTSFKRARTGSSTNFSKSLSGW